MKTVTIRDFRAQPRRMREMLAEVPEAVLTVNGKPVALMLSVDSGTLDETLETIRRARALQTVAAIRKRARTGGQGELSVKDIDAEVRAARQVRLRRSRRTGRA